MKRCLFVALVTLVLTGCPSRPPEPDQPPVTIKPITLPAQEKVPPGETVPQPPKIQSFDWAASLVPLIDKMLQEDNVPTGSVLLLGSVKNSTNGALQTTKATSALQQVLTSNNKFVLITADQLAAAKQTLGLSEEDSLSSRTKAIGLARHLSAQYVLYSDVSGNVKEPTIDMQLMLVQTGEIIWSGNGPVKR